jgi:excisionase family DNA binding protein
MHSNCFLFLQTTDNQYTFCVSNVNSKFITKILKQEGKSLTIYTVGQAAELLTVSDQIVREWLRNGTLKGSKIGSGTFESNGTKWRITEESIHEFLKRGER